MMPFALDLDTDINNDVTTKVSSEAAEYCVYTSAKFPPEYLWHREEGFKRDSCSVLLRFLEEDYPPILTDLTTNREGSIDSDKDTDSFFTSNYDIIVEFPKPKSRKVTVKVKSVTKFKPKIVID